MNDIKLAQLDLNLLVVLDVLLQERSVTRAAKRLHRTQSAVSHALARIRSQLGDPLLVRVGGEMRTTPRGERLSVELTRLLGDVGRVLAAESTFDPSTTKRTFTLAAPDFVAAVLPALHIRLAREAPDAGLDVLPLAPGFLRDVVDGRLDLAIGAASASLPEGASSAPLGALDWVVYARRGHPAVGDWGLRAWAAYPHVRVRITGGEGPVDRAARVANVERQVAVQVSHFAMTPPLLAATDLLFTVPRAVLRAVAEPFGLIELSCPLPLPPVGARLLWSALLDDDPANVWLRSHVQRTLTAFFVTAAR
jgi:DNA-binding transcriptional LysR family regulator